MPQFLVLCFTSFALSRPCGRSACQQPGVVRPSPAETIQRWQQLDSQVVRLRNFATPTLFPLPAPALSRQRAHCQDEPALRCCCAMPPCRHACHDFAEPQTIALLDDHVVGKGICHAHLVRKSFPKASLSSLGLRLQPPADLGHGDKNQTAVTAQRPGPACRR